MEIINSPDDIKARGGTKYIWVPEDEYKKLKDNDNKLSLEELELIQWLKEHKIFKDLSQFIKKPNSINRLVSGLMGWTWENQFMQQCENFGYKVVKATNLDYRYDYIVNGLKVQCKHTSTKSNCIDIRNSSSESNRRYRSTDFDILAVRHNQKEYIIPVSLILQTVNNYNNGVVDLPSSIDISKYQICQDNWEELR